MPTTNVLVTGSTGFVGSALVECLLNKEVFHVTGTVRALENKNLPRLSEVLVQNISPDTNWIEHLRNIDIIVHLAARVHIMKENKLDSLTAYRSLNVQSTLNLARQAIQAGVKRFVYVSSVKVNGEKTFPGVPFTEIVLHPPADPYGLSKYEAEIELRKLTQNTSMEVVIIRPPLVYGAGVKANFKVMMELLYKGIPLPLGATDNKRSLVSVENLVDFIAVSLLHPLAANETFLISDDDDLSTTKLLKLLAQKLDRPANLIPVPPGLMKCALKLIGKEQISQRLFESLQVDISKAKTLLRWQPPLTVDAALKKTVNSFLRNKGH